MAGERSLYHPKLVAVVAQPLQSFGQGMLQLVDALERIVEGDDAARACISLYVLEHFLGRKAVAIVARDHVPHDDTIAAVAKHLVLHSRHPPVGWTEEVCVEDFVGLLGIGQIVPRLPSEAADVIIRMVTDAVASATHLFEQVGILVGIVSHHEVGGLGPKAIQHIECKRRSLRDRAVIKSEIDGPVLGVYSP